VKVTVLLTAALGGARLLGDAPAAARHHLWTALFVAVLALPFLGAALPALPVSLPRVFSWATAPPAVIPVAAPDPATRGVVSSPAPASATTESTQAPRQTSDARRGAPTGPSTTVVLAATWLAGSCVGVVLLAVSLVRVRTLRRRAEVMTDPSWHESARRIAERLGLSHRPDLLIAGSSGGPMAAGWWRPAIFLPDAARDWTPECRDVVLTHELVHLAQRDPLRMALSRLVVASYWFHPLAWMAAGRSAAAREEAADEAVLACGTRPSSYARVLLELAGAAGAPRMAAVLPMIQHTHLEGRLMAILKDSRPAVGRFVVWPAALVIVLTCAVAAVRPAASTASAAGAPMVRSAREPATAGAGVPMPAVQASTLRDSVCWASARVSGSFTGTVSTSGDGLIINDQIGRRGRDDIVMHRFGDLRVCMVAQDVDREDARPSELLGTARHLVLESERGGAVERLEVARDTNRTIWEVNGRERAFDAAAGEWRSRMLALLDSVWDRSMLQGQVSSLRGEISSVRGEESSLRGEISSLNGEVSSMDGEISSIRGHESSLNGEISSIQGHLSSLEGEISSEQGAISSLDSSGYNADSAERVRIAASIKDHSAAIRRIQRAIDDYDAPARIARVRREMNDFDGNGKIAAVQARIDAFNLNAKVADVERRIGRLDVEGQVASMERQITALDADRRTAALDRQIDDELRRLQTAIAAIR